jgi:translation initiation factor IF-2
MFVVAEDAITSTRSIQNFKGETIETASFSSSIHLCGFDKMPRIGSGFKTFKTKKDALEYAQNWKNKETIKPVHVENSNETSKKIIPILVKTDVSGSLEAIEKEISKIKCKGEVDNAEFKIIAKGVGPISESDIKSIANNKDTIIIGFNVKADKSALEIAKKRELTISFFDIIYKMTEWLEGEMERLRPRIETVETTGQAKIVRAFSRTKERQIIGGKVIKGSIVLNGAVKIIRRGFEIGRGKIVNLEKSKVKTSVVEEGVEFGMMIESKIEIAQGDIIELFSIAQK